jgi:hypothetical protein
MKYPNHPSGTGDEGPAVGPAPPCESGEHTELILAAILVVVILALTVHFFLQCGSGEPAVVNGRWLLGFLTGCHVPVPRRLA